MDPAVGAYLQDENGDLLSIQEVRQKLINGEKIVLNNDAILPPDLYFHYMSKNLFRFSCSFISEFNFESKTGKFICNLYPKLYMDILNQRKTRR